jgi:hypothetical protein
MSYFFGGQVEEAEDLCESGLEICEKRGIGVGSVPIQMFLFAILLAKGNIKQGFKKFEEIQEVLSKDHWKVLYAQSECILGTVFTQFVTSPPPGLANMANNTGSIVNISSFAYERAEEHFNKALAL